MKDQAAGGVLERTASGRWTDLGLTLPIFIAYHLGVIWLPARNAADWVTHQLVALADHDLTKYGGLTLGLGALYVGMLWAVGKGQALNGPRFLWLSVEAVAYAIAMRLCANHAVAQLLWDPGVTALGDASAVAAAPGVARGMTGLPALAAGIVMSFGAGFYEELAFRVGLFGAGWKLLCVLFPLSGALTRTSVQLGWAVLGAFIFSGWHYVGELGDRLELASFTFRFVCGLIFTLIYKFRGFAPVVWTHSLYDVWIVTAAGSAQGAS